MTSHKFLLTVAIVCSVWVPFEARAETPASNATEAQTSAEHSASDTPRAVQSNIQRGFSVKVAAGANYARIFSVPTYGGEVSLALGGRYNDTFAYVGFNLEHAQTEMGLPIWGGHAGLSLEQKFGVVRVGAATRVGYWNIRRVSHNDSLESASSGVAAHISLDLLRTSDEGAVFLQAELRADYYAEPFVFNPNLSLGFRWDAKHRL